MNSDQPLENKNKKQSKTRTAVAAQMETNATGLQQFIAFKIQSQLKNVLNIPGILPDIKQIPYLTFQCHVLLKKLTGKSNSKA